MDASLSRKRSWVRIPSGVPQREKQLSIINVCGSLMVERWVTKLGGVGSNPTSKNKSLIEVINSIWWQCD